MRIGYYEALGGRVYDFHFMKRSNTNNVWSFKAGVSGKVYKLKKGKTPDKVNWNIYYINSRRIYREKVYFSKISYLAISN